MRTLSGDITIPTVLALLRGDPRGDPLGDPRGDPTCFILTHLISAFASLGSFFKTKRGLLNSVRVFFFSYFFAG